MFVLRKSGVHEWVAPTAPSELGHDTYKIIRLRVPKCLTDKVGSIVQLGLLWSELHDKSDFPQTPTTGIQTNDGGSLHRQAAPASTSTSSLLKSKNLFQLPISAAPEATTFRMRKIQIVKSALQKATRRRNVSAAVLNALYLIRFHQETELLRRLVIICVEDVGLSEDLPRLVWLMCAVSSARYILSTNDIIFILLFVQRMASFERQTQLEGVNRFYEGPSDVDERRSEDANGGVDVSMVPPVFLQNRSGRGFALFVRACYGGMPCDVDLMLQAMAWSKRFLESDGGTQEESGNRGHQLFQEAVIAALPSEDEERCLSGLRSGLIVLGSGANSGPAVESVELSCKDLESVSWDLPPEARLAIGVDFHISNIIPSCFAGTGVSEDVASDWIWNYRSGVNVREQIITTTEKTSVSYSVQAAKDIGAPPWGPDFEAKLDAYGQREWDVFQVVQVSRQLPAMPVAGKGNREKAANSGEIKITNKRTSASKGPPPGGGIMAFFKKTKVG